MTSTAIPLFSEGELRSLSTAGGEDQGFGSLETVRGHLPLEALVVEACIDGLVAETSVTQTFINVVDEPVEATYIFPLPDRAAVTRFRMQVRDRVVDGMLQERAEARRVYDEALHAGHRAAIAEEERPGVFTMRVGNLMPGDKATIHLTLVGPLLFSDGEATYRFPLVVAPRYISGLPLSGSPVGVGVAPDTDAVPDASRITPPVLLPGFPNPVRLAIAVELNAGTFAIDAVRSSLHAIEEQTRDGSRRIEIRPGERLNRDFILRFRLGGEAVATSLALTPDVEGHDGTFMLTVVPPARSGAAPRARDIVFVLDRSGSMRGWKMVAARRAVARMVDTLTDRDRFGILAFDDSIETAPAISQNAIVEATDRTRFRVIEWLAQIEGRGGTELAQPLQRAIDLLHRQVEGRDRVLVLLTDGQVGNEDQILRTLGARLEGLRIFTIGIDRAVNEAFLRRLAMLGGGLSEVVESDDRLDEVMARVHDRLGPPVLSRLRLEANDLSIDAESVVPRRLPALFPGVPLFVLGRYRGPAGGGVTVNGEDEAGTPWSAAVAGAPTVGAAVRAIWARGRVRDLEDRYVIEPSRRPELAKTIVTTSLRFGVLSRFTAFVAVDQSEAVNPGGVVHHIPQPVEVPDAWVLRLGPRMMPDSMCGLTLGSAAGIDMAMLDEGEAPVRAVVSKPAFLARMFRSQSAPSAAAEPTDAYRRRAGEVLDELRHAVDLNDASAARRRALGIAARRLTDLISDLRSVGILEGAFAPLVQLLADLRSALAGSPSDADVRKLWIRIVETLDRIASERSRAPRGDFWK